ncbi:MAG: selenide, water dikinase SelD [Verrucomicrobia bacterium]|jgi:selenide,water dikinase|nr:selenide, water dikinase SelD [Verrucomicrobiota bacterium]MBT7912043.1 selenide, water dikinase SelD [Verrucomicrobiota bacterium]MDC0319228.1 selenide, water dikinase SelD [Verrucomicrobiota bacterium]
MDDPVRLTQYCRSAGCGCKIAPSILEEILSFAGTVAHSDRLLVGNDSRDDAAVFDLGNGQAIVSTTDFFMPIVDDPFDFGQIASVNAISDVYAMGGKPLMAIAVLGWPLDKLPPEVAGRVLEGGRAACACAGIPLAGGHSIDSPEPIFGLAVTGQVAVENLKRNDRAVPGCELFLTKPLGVGLVATAQKRGLADQADFERAVKQMIKLNSLGALLGSQSGVKAMTDVSGFGLLGHLTEMCEGSGVSATLDSARVPRLENIDRYIDEGCTSGGTDRNFDSYGPKIGPLTRPQKALLCDPQTSGGLLVAVAPDGLTAFEEVSAELNLQSFGQITEATGPLITVN